MTAPAPASPPAPATETTPAETAPVTEPTAPATAEPVDLTSEVEKWKHFAREHEKTAKANAEAARRLAEIEDAAKSQAERDAEAKAAAERRAVAAEAELLRMRVAAAKGVPAELAGRLIGETEAEMSDDADRLMAAMKPKGVAPTGSADGGPQGGQAGKPAQLDRGALDTMTPDQINAAREAGQLNDLLGIK